MSSLTFESNNPDPQFHIDMNPVPSQHTSTETVVENFFAKAEKNRVRAADIGFHVLSEVTRGSATDNILREALGSKAIESTKIPEKNNDEIGKTHFTLPNGDRVHRVTLHDTSHFLLFPPEQRPIEVDDFDRDR